jgi:hypothetical protein
VSPHCDELNYTNRDASLNLTDQEEEDMLTVQITYLFVERMCDRDSYYCHCRTPVERERGEGRRRHGITPPPLGQDFYEAGS